MRVALVGPTHPYKGGVAQHTTRLAHELAARGHEVELVSWSAQYPALLYPGQQKVEVPEQPVFPRTTYPLSWRWPVGWWRTGRRLARSADLVVLVLVTPVQAPALATLMRALRGTRTLVLCHNVLPHERRAIDERLVRSVLGRADAVLVHAEGERTTAQSLTRAPVAVSALPPHFVSGPGSTPRAVERPPLRSVLFFGIVRPYKGLDVLLRALADVPDVRLVVRGEFWGGPEQARALAAELGLADRVDLQDGYVEAGQVPELFDAADALVLPYRSSTASQNASLGHEHGVPVVATRVGTMAQDVQDGQDGLLCEPGDPASLAAALRRLYEPGVLEQLRSGIRPSDGHQQWDAYVTAIEQAGGL